MSTDTTPARPASHPDRAPYGRMIDSLRPLRDSIPGRLDAWPATRSARWSMRLAFAIPFIIAGLLAKAGGWSSAETPNGALLRRVSEMSWDRADAAWIGNLYPPITTVLARLDPFGETGLALLGAFVAGFVLQKVAETMVRRYFPLSTIIALLTALAANPLFFLTTLGNLPALLGLSFFGLAMSDLARFVLSRNTQSGFRAGIFLMLAALSDSAGILYVLVAVLTAPLIGLGRRDLRVRPANLLVAAFPTTAAFVTVAFLQWVFVGDPFDFARRVIDITPVTLQVLPTLTSTTLGLALDLTLVSSWLIAILLKRPGLILASTLLFAAVMSARVLGMIPPTAVGITYTILLFTAATTIPAPRATRMAALINCIALVQIALAWFTSAQRPDVMTWIESILHALLSR